MRRTGTLPAVLALAALVVACSDEPVAPGPELAAPALELSVGQAGGGSHIVVFKKGVPADFADAVAALGGTVTYASDAVGAAAVSGLSDDAAAALGRVKGVQLVEPEPMFHLLEPTSVSAPEVAVPASPSDPTTASAYARQWNMRAIDADDAWAAGRLGSSDVTVAILDTGLDYLYPDLAGRVDLARSISFVPIDDSYVAFFFPGAHPIADIGYHGTHVGATVASNALVLAGVTSQVTLMGVKVCSVVTGGCSGSAIFAGIDHAVTNGADVINMSLGGGFNKSDYPGYVSLINRLFNYARTSGVTIVVSAGNEAIDLDHTNASTDPDVGPSFFKTYCDAPGIVCVSATGPASSDDTRFGPWYDVDAPADYTNFGRSAITVAAPGGTGAGLVWAGCSGFSLAIPACQTGTYIIGLGGTSMASPHTAGTAALLVEDYGRRPGRIKAALQQSADDLGQPGTDPFYGKGRINVAKAAGVM